MLLNTYKIETEYTKIGKLKKDGARGKEIKYSRERTIHDFCCDSCQNLFTEIRDPCRFKEGQKHLCPTCRVTPNSRSVIFKEHLKEKEDLSKIGSRRIHAGSKYPEVYVGIDSWHTKCQGHWAREHIFVMKNSLGYKIPKGYVVHHHDGDKSNNKIENLSLLTVEEHNRAHAKSEEIVFSWLNLDQLGLTPKQRCTS